MKDIQTLFTQSEEMKKELKFLRKAYRDALQSLPDYEETVDKTKQLKLKKDHLAAQARALLGDQWTRTEELTAQLKALNEQMSDVALSHIKDGALPTIHDSNNVAYEIAHHITLKKAA